MKRRIFITLLTVAAIFTFAVSGVLAAWQAKGETINKISMASVNGSVLETFESGLTVYPGTVTEKVVNVKNTGNTDCAVRVKVEMLWGSEHDENGNLISDQILSSDNIQITYNSVDWYYSETDGYYYYKGILAPGETTSSPLFKEFTVSEDTGNEYGGKEANIRVQMECIQAGDNSLSMWGVDEKELGIDYSSKKPASADTAVVFMSPDDGFRFDADEGDLFHNFKNLVPGDSVTQVITVKNEYSKNVEIFFYAETTDQIYATDETRELIDKLLKEYAFITITDEQGKVIYEGPVWGNLDKSGNTVSLKDPVSLSTFAANQSRKYIVSLSMDPKADNELHYLLGLVKWIFYAEGAEGSADGGKKPGDAFGFELYIIIMAISGAMSAFLIAKRKNLNDKRRIKLPQ